MNKVYYLANCSTCRRILKEVNPDDTFVLQDIKEKPISEEQLNELYSLTGSYLNIFNKQSRKYRELSLHNKDLSENEIRELILGEYTFLKRPVFIVDDRIFVGNSRKTIAELSAYMQVRKNKVRVFRPMF